MQITGGKIQRAQKVVLYGPEGIGKSTFAAQFPDPVFIDTEGSTYKMDVRRFDAPSSWTMLLQEIDYVSQHPEACKTLVLDTADWAENLCAEEICAKNHVSGIEDFGYGKGYTYLMEHFGKMLNTLDALAGRGINICVNAHAKMRKFEQPDEMGAYDRWEMKLSKQCAPLLKEWADTVLFANYKTTVITTKDGAKKGTGGQRVMYATHSPCWDAKNRDGLPDEMPFAFAGISQYIPNAFADQAPKIPETKPMEKSAPQEKAQEAKAPARDDMRNVPKEIADLCISSGVTEDAVRGVVAAKGYYPEDTPISAYDPEFIKGWLIPFWDKVSDMILRTSLPF